MRRFALLGGVAVLLCSGTAWATTFEYDAPAECPARVLVEQRIAERTTLARDTRLRITHAAKGFVGTAQMGSGEDAVERRIDGSTCQGVLDALVVVLALDEQVQVAPAEPPRETTLPTAARRRAPVRTPPTLRGSTTGATSAPRSS